MTAVALAVAVGITSGCGGGDRPQVSDLAPADSAVFVEAHVRPDGDSAKAAEKLAVRLLGGQGPRAKLGGLAAQALAASGPRVNFPG